MLHPQINYIILSLKPISISNNLAFLYKQISYDLVLIFIHNYDLTNSQFMTVFVFMSIKYPIFPWLVEKKLFIEKEGL